MRYYLNRTYKNVIKMMALIHMLTCTLILAQDANRGAEEVENNRLLYELATDILDATTPCEKTTGPYVSELGDQLLNMGRYYKNLGALGDAIRVLVCARHVITINAGKDSLNQVPVLDELIDINTLSKNWLELDRNIMDMYLIYRRHLDPNDTALLQIIDQSRRWKLSVYNNGLLSTKLTDTIEEIIDLTKSKIESQEALYGESDPRLIISLRELAAAQYEMIKQLLNVPIGKFPGSDYTSANRIDCRVVGNTNVCFNRNVPNPTYIADRQIYKVNSMKHNMQSVKDTLMRIKGIYEFNSKEPLKDYVISLLDLGDWSLINQQQTKAFEYYKQSYELLQNNSTGEVNLKERFGLPILIPAMDNILFNNTSSSSMTQIVPYVKLTFDVTKEGKTRRIKIIEQSNPDSFKASKLAKEILKSMMFRPQLVDGSPILTRNVEYKLSGSFLN